MDKSGKYLYKATFNGSVQVKKTEFFNNPKVVSTLQLIKTKINQAAAKKAS